MTTREEIREGIRGILIDKYLTGTRLTVIDYYAITEYIVNYLDSQGVVIKVDGELPAVLNDQMVECPNCRCAFLENLDTRICKAGYAAVEPLIEEA